VAAAVDYETVNGERHGDLARTIADRVKARRRLALGLDQPSPDPMPLPTHRTPDEKRRHEVEGGTVIVGRHTLKEFMAGLKWGWTGTLAKVDTEELVARELQDDPVFDESEEEGERTEDAPHAPPSEKRESPSPPNLPIYSPLQHMHPLTKRPKPESSLHESVVDEPPALIPQQPPLLLVPFTNHIGFTQIPYMLWDFFNERKRVRDGGEAAYRLIMKNTRPFVGSSPSIPNDETSSTADASTQSDLDFDKKAESYYRRSLSSTLSTIEKARNKYLKELPTRLKVARDLARGVREPTKDEWNNPPSTEVELRAERMRKEVRWRKDKEGWDIVRPDSETSWDERFDGALSVFVDPPSDDPHEPTPSS
jgi:import inner membrane translocase subunit TIM54